MPKINPIFKQFDDGTYSVRLYGDGREPVYLPDLASAQAAADAGRLVWNKSADEQELNRVKAECESLGLTEHEFYTSLVHWIEKFSKVN